MNDPHISNVIACFRRKIDIYRASHATAGVITYPLTVLEAGNGGDWELGSSHKVIPQQAYTTRSSDIEAELTAPNGKSWSQPLGLFIGNGFRDSAKGKRITSFHPYTATGKHVMRMASTTMKAVTLETGGKLPLIVFDDANLDQAVRWVHEGIMANQGPVCTATSSLLVPDGIYDRFVEEFTDYTSKTSMLGDPFEATTYQGPQVSAAQRDRVLSYIRTAQTENVNIIHPCRAIQNFLERATIFKEEIFGPCAAVAQFKTEQEALDIANSTQYGLAGAVFTRDMARSHRVARELEAGMVWINSSSDFDVRAPFGGVEECGIGRELGEDGLRGYYSVKAVHVNLTES
ncbi:aldehyde dehydrogenase [Metarhizium acridum CQMa 102]|uniref:Aldehyde dehydrogenase n=1 Tax=Metarhizium acridum (strain CQMa 102) TaxID=655827 RepID=E9DRP7_METAQ|nr:aldehyde dehydrogenase [Metarhizium acridum CQMa 102]EFY93925.1 aldehyde dehydrogenase [Metarhizium acridum CQMa 102]